ncbi:Glutathione S-transferase domain protein [Salinisphaera sp. S4-8]|uniref:glutathione S-transferase family protein n=1 Tax=Salinisphaera sp. S4-8 TaxID=633357 RepID=UPI00333E56C8
MKIDLYAHRLSQPSRAVEILLRELAIPYTWHAVDFANGETRQAWFARHINAFETIPALVVEADDAAPETAPSRLAESQAIMRYLCRIAPDREASAHWYATDDALRCARTDTWLAWHHNNVRAFDMFHDIMNLHLTLPMLKYELQANKLKPLQDGLRGGLAQLERQLAGQTGPTPTLCGHDHPDLADLAIACELYQIAAVGYRFTGFAHVARWLDTVAERPHFRDVSREILDQGRTIREHSGDYLDLTSAFA